MSIFENWILTELAGQYVAVPVNGTSDFHGIIRLNETARDIWTALAGGQTKEQAAEYLTAHYAEITIEKARAEVQKVVDLLKDEGVELV